MCEIGNTFSKVVICRRFCPAGGQPFFQAFLRLPDHNPLKRLEAFFRVISSRRRRGALHPMGPASFYSTRCKTSLVARSRTLSLPFPEQQPESFFARESLASRGTPSLTKIMQRRTHPSFLFLLRNYPSLLSLLVFAKIPPRRPLSQFPCSFSLLLFRHFYPLDTVAVRKLK